MFTRWQKPLGWVFIALSVIMLPLNGVAFITELRRSVSFEDLQPYIIGVAATVGSLLAGILLVLPTEGTGGSSGLRKATMLLRAIVRKAKQIRNKSVFIVMVGVGTWVAYASPKYYGWESSDEDFVVSTIMAVLISGFFVWWINYVEDQAARERLPKENGNRQPC